MTLIRCPTGGSCSSSSSRKFDFTDDPRRFWIVIEPVGCSVCLTDPGFDVDAWITSDVRTLHMVLMGREQIRAAIRDGRVALTGTPALVRRLPRVLTLTTLAELAGMDGLRQGS